MPQIFFENNIIHVKIDDLKSSQVDWEINAYFSALGAKFDDEKEIFSFTQLTPRTDLIKIIRDTKELFEQKGCETTLDQNCEQIIKQFNESAVGLEKSLEKGRTIKESDNNSLILPNFFKRKLMDYQKKSVKHLFEVGNAANFSVPGSGKTTIAYAAYSLMKERGDVEKILVICPMSAFMAWEDEYEDCFEVSKAPSLRLDGSILKNFNRQIRGQNSHMKVRQEIVLSTYQLASLHTTPLSLFLTKYKTLLILDESHHVKNPVGEWSHSVRRLAPYAKKRFILTGTPNPNSLSDIWSQFTFLWPLNDLLGTSHHYFKDYVKANDLGRYRTIIDPLFLRIKKDDLGLKAPKAKTKLCPIPTNSIQKKIYDAIEMTVIEELQQMQNETFQESSKMHKWRRAKMIRLIQAASNPALLNKSDIEFNLDPVTNVDAEVSKLIEEYTKYNEIPVKVHEACKLARNLVESGEKVIIWTSFLHNIDMIIVQLLKDLQPLHIDGRIPKDESKDYEFNREKIIRLFKNDPKFKILIATPPSCAESISLHKNSRKETVCKNAIYLDRTFNAGQYMQSKDRIHRIGMDQDTQVMYYVFIAKGTIDEYIDQRLATKEDNMLQFLRDDFRIVDLNSREIALTEDEVNRDMKKYIDFLRKKGRI